MKLRSETGSFKSANWPVVMPGVPWSQYASCTLPELEAKNKCLKESDVVVPYRAAIADCPSSRRN